MSTESVKKSLDTRSESLEKDSETSTLGADEQLADRISQRAFEINKVRGIKPCPEIRDWVQAEREILAEAGQPAKTQKQAYSS